jgi:hypothetical protein
MYTFVDYTLVQSRILDCTLLESSIVLSSLLSCCHVK